MSKNLVQKILEEHLLYGKLLPDSEIAIRVDQTLTQDANGTMAYLQFEALGIPKVKTKLSVSYVDHYTLQSGFESADAHAYLQSIAAKYGIYFSRPGNGICHQVHLERFSVPGEVLLGLDRHTSTCGGAGMLAIGACSLDIALAMAGEPFYLKMPKILGVKLVGKLNPWATAKDLILHILGCLRVEGGVGWILEYFGCEVKSLSVPERATITNMGAELGATSSIFPSDEPTLEYLSSQKREASWRHLEADEDAKYDEIMEINLSEIEPLIAIPHSPDKVREINQILGIKVDQVIIGSCTNSSYRDLMSVTAILRGKRIHLDVDLVIVPGSRQVLERLIENGAFMDLLRCGARILEPACGPCIGICQAPRSAGVSLRSFNRNFYGRSGTQDAQVYLASPEICAISALKGEISDPRELGEPLYISMFKEFKIDDSLIIDPVDSPAEVEIIRGSNIKSIPINSPLPEDIGTPVLLKVGDNITTVDILPGGDKLLPLRSNIPELAQYAFNRIDPSFLTRAIAAKMGIRVSGSNYGQGSNYEYVALALEYLGIKAVIAKSFDKNHQTNLANFGIMPLIFESESGYDWINQGDILFIAQLHTSLRERRLKVRNLSRNVELWVKHDLSDRLIEILLTGGVLNYIASRS